MRSKTCRNGCFRLIYYTEYGLNGVPVKKMISLLVVSSLLVCAAPAWVYGSAPPAPLNVTLKPKQPNWRAEIVEFHPQGSPKMAIYYEPGVEGETPVKQVFLYPNGSIQAEMDLIQVRQVDSDTKEEKFSCVPHGFRIDLGENGSLFQISSYDRGVLQGEVRTHFPSGKVQGIFLFQEGLLDGLAQSFYENGQLHEEARYVKGLAEGDVVTYFENGARASVVPYREGKVQGLMTEWHLNGRLQAQRQFENGQPHGNGKTPAVILYDEDLNVSQMMDFRDGQPSGVHITYYKNGKEAHRLSYQEGKRHGKEQFFAEDGTVLGEGTYVLGKAVGKHWRNHPDGGLAYLAEFDSEGVLQGTVTEYNEEGQKVREFYVADDQLQGLAREWYPNGVIRAEYQYVNSQYDGEQKEYYPSGQIKTLAHYKDKKRDGIHEQWHENGVLACRGAFAEGAKNGRIAEWHPDGTAKIDSYFEMDRPEGIHSEWYENGQLKFRVEFAQGEKEGWQREWNGAGELIAEAFYQKGQFEGIVSTWWNKDQLKTQFVYRAGKKEGKHEWFSELGRPLRAMHFVDDQLDGETKAWYPDGALQLVQTYRNGKPIGEHIEYYPRSKPSQLDSERLCRLFHYDDEGRLHGEEKSFYPNGHIQSLVSYQHGQLHGAKQLWDENGALMEEAFYAQGKLEGRYFQRLPDLQELVFFYEGSLKQGFHEMYYPPNEKGEKIKAFQANFEKDKIHGTATEYNQQGMKLAEIPYVAGVKEGTARLYGANGVLAATVQFVADKRHGLGVQYFPNGAILRETSYRLDKREGEERTFFENGALASLCYYQNDQLHGLSQSWNKEQILVFEAEYAEGMRHGKFNKYYEDGSPCIEQTFVYDQLSGRKYKYERSGEVVVSDYEEGRLVNSVR